MIFKVGDKVKLRPEFINIWPQGTKVGTVIKCLDNSNSIDGDFIYVTYEGLSIGNYFPYRPYEIEKVRIKGEQLLLFE